MMRQNGTRSNEAQMRSDTVLLIIDMITDFHFDDGDALYRNSIPAAERIAKLRKRAKESGVPVIYVNDNYNDWTKDFDALIERVTADSEKGRKIVDLVRPDEDDYYILKPQRSGFYATPLGVLLLSMNVSKIIITGVTTDICVLFTAHDAHMRGFSVQIPSDCAAAVEEEHHKFALDFLQRVADVEVLNSEDISFDKPAASKSPDMKHRRSLSSIGAQN